ncbi:thiol:disulfide interchange protein DsbA/DsbL [Pseudomonadales bacterium]|nr:thiol:disulfide interchange protein DsbA/DsbL [Pseudomonadales bacterium]
MTQTNTLARFSQNRSTRFIFSLILLVLLAGCGQGKSAKAELSKSINLATGLIEGTHYAILEDPWPAQDGIVTVKEFFWYGCPHCESFEPTLHRWQKNLPAEVSLEQVPAVWAKLMDLHAKAFFIAQSMQAKEAVHADLFKTITALRSEPSMQKHQVELENLFVKHGLPAEAFQEQLNDDDLKARLKNAKVTMKRSGATSTPTLMVNGRYLVLNTTAKSHKDITNIADKLIALELENINQ